MKRSQFLRGGVLAAGWLGGLGALPALAQGPAWPARPIRLIVPTAPGGPSDLVARSWTHGVAADWNASFVVDNRPGGSQVIGTQAVATAPADGYTLLQAASSMATMPLVVENLPFDVNKDFVAVSQTHLTPLVVVVDARLPIRTMAELVRYAKEQPGKLSFGHTGEGSSQQLATRLLAQKAGLQQLLEVPYKGSSQAHPDLISGRLSAMVDPVSAVAAHIKSGALRALAVTTATRVAAFPELPTVAESGVPGFEISSWGGVFAPAGTPRELVQRIHLALRKTLETPETAKKFSDWGLVARTSTPAEFDGFVKAEVARWRAVMLAPKT
ncbi:Bug family tripartite tricarboxylate transporter substrate binding protein [Pseudorhodoferax sp.]|uniref:Bug family tripartite tricarboxylate transporter substrate binding protein n=1 Tax=Pseudorhodoferax sp. TaxID=1993553 RepID=UPI002DD66FFD|nr:tripartite tricarboxylate transporter substrate binding protein [Pseudorhodoferax sp.]